MPAPATTASPAVTVPGSLATAPDKFLAGADVRLRYRDSGRGEPVVFLHGLAGRLDQWFGLADSLAPGYRVIALDERGFGESTKFTDPQRYGQLMVDDVVRLLDTLRISRAHFVGHSMGAVIAANLALRYPERVITASLLAPPMYVDSLAFAGASATYAADLEGGAGFTRMIQFLEAGTSDSVAARWSSQVLASNPPSIVVPALRSMGGLMIATTQAGRLQAPTLIAVGTRDGLLPQDRWLATWWPHARLLEVPEVGHGAIIQRPEVWAAVRSMMRTSSEKERR
jgi:pimeloyl-ACP methyl ester carboxylesterase